jgi:CBS domain-containing protein
MTHTLDPRITNFDHGRYITPSSSGWATAPSRATPAVPVQAAPDLRRSPARRPTVADLMDTEVVTLPPDAPALEAAHQLIARDVEEVVVVSGGRPLGVLTRRDLIRCRATDLDALSGRAVESLLPGRTRRMLPDIDIATAAAVLAEEQRDAAPVVDRFGDLIGVLATRHIVGHVAHGEQGVSR